MHFLIKRILATFLPNEHNIILILYFQSFIIILLVWRSGLFFSLATICVFRVLKNNVWRAPTLTRANDDELKPRGLVWIHIHIAYTLWRVQFWRTGAGVCVCVFCGHRGATLLFVRRWIALYYHYWLVRGAYKHTVVHC